MKNFYWSDPPGQTAFPVAKAGYPLIFAAAFVTIVFALLGFTALALTCLVITLFICCFFRDPDRVIPNKKDVVVSPADGKVVAADITENSPYYEGRCVRISIFMSVFNVHVNRVPYDGAVKDVRYHPGKFFAANKNKASGENEQNAVFIETEGGKTICVVQVAGLVARRIICGVQEGDKLVRGQRFGMICFGSRLDVYLPADTEPAVIVGDRVEAGTSVLGYLS
ncbi:phosphatidylserine decarboxylase family protein [Desulfococcaceae bacterium HSG8]|nr:phosphatidylserine decarboxylase family protein [Desulfococcaceae bacterium HSG8]